MFSVRICLKQSRTRKEQITSNPDFCKEIDYINKYKKVEKNLGIPRGYFQTKH